MLALTLGALSFNVGLNLPASPAVARAVAPAMAAKQTPHGGKLIDLFVSDAAAVAGVRQDARGAQGGDLWVAAARVVGAAREAREALRRRARAR